MFDFVALKDFLDANGYKQKFIAQKANMTEAALSAILSGRIKCSLENYVNLCRVLSVPFETFISENAPIADAPAV